MEGNVRVLLALYEDIKLGDVFAACNVRGTDESFLAEPEADKLTIEAGESIDGIGVIGIVDNEAALFGDEGGEAAE